MKLPKNMRSFLIKIRTCPLLFRFHTKLVPILQYLKVSYVVDNLEDSAIDCRSSVVCSFHLVE